MIEEEIDDSSGSDFDDDEDPDKIQVPGLFVLYNFLINKNQLFFLSLGGGMNLNAAAGIIESRENKVKTENVPPQTDVKPQLSVLPNNKTIANMSGQFDMMRNQASKYMDDIATFCYKGTSTSTLDECGR